MDRPPRKYQPLADYLATLDRDEVTLTFAQMECIIGVLMPPAAHTRQFWINNPRSRSHPSREWLQVGWRVVTAEPRQERVTFGRDGSHMPETAAGAPPR